MAIKPFAIQGADLTLGGVSLQAGTTGVVIPGVTQAANYKVEEVNDTDVDQTYQFAAESEVVVVDYVLYNAIINEATENLYADYTATTDDEGYLDEIEVNGQGTYTAQQATDNARNDMYAYVGASSASDRPLVPEDWIQIPFRPKMRAGEVENIGGGSGNLEDITVSIGEGETSLNLANKDFTINTTRTEDQDADINLTAADDIFITALNDDIVLYANDQVRINTDDENHEWTFDANGHIIFPDGSIQTTAYTGTGDSNVWIQDFESDLGSPTDVPGLASSVEYLDNGDLVALFNHYTDPEGRYNSVARFDTTGTQLWATRFSSGTYTDGWGLAVDSNFGFIYVAGRASAETYDVGTLTKIDQDNGMVLWSKKYDIGFNNTNAVVDVASDGNPIVVGYAYDGVDYQVVTTKIDADTGAVLWSRSLDGQNGEEAYGMAVGPSGETVAVGWMDNIEYAGPVNTILTLSASPASDPDWTTNQSITVGGVSFDVSFTDGVPTFSNIVDLDGNHTVGETISNIPGISIGSGSTMLTVTVGTITTEDMSDRMLVVKYDGTGAIQWQKAVQVETGFYCTGADADIDGDGNIYVCGSFDYDNNSNTDTAMIIIKFDSSGAKQWTRKVVGNCDDWSTSVVVGPDNCLYLSGVTGDNNSGDYSMVVAKYNLDGTVAWQRLVDNTTTWTFAGANWFGPGGQGSTIAVKTDYVAVVGGFADPGNTVPHAILAQFDSDGTVWSAGNYDFKAATFSGLLDSSASNITVADAGKTDSDYTGEYSTTDFAPDSDTSNFLIGTLYGQTGVSTGDVTFAGDVVQGSQWELGLSPGPDFTTGAYTSAGPDLGPQYFRIRGGDNWEHLHFDTTANNVFDLYIGDDDTYFKLSKDGQAVIGTESRTDPYDRYTWTFGIDGSTTFPTLTVPISDNATPNGTGQTLKFSDSTQQAIIFGPTSTADVVNAERIIIQGAPGYTGTSGEGGDVYLWAGPGGDTGGDGGDIKVRAGRGNGAGSGGYLYFQTGSTNTGYAGSIRLETGTSGTYGQGGPITLDARSGGQILLRTYNSEGNSRDLILSNAGTLTLPGAVVNSTVAKTGADINANDVVFVVTAVDGLGAVTELTVTNSPNPAWVSGTNGISLTDVDFTVSFDGSGNASVTVNSSGNGHSVSETFTLSASTVGATAPTPIALDLTKSVNKLAEGAYSLADGTEGQIMYLVRSPTTTSANVFVDVLNGDGTNPLAPFLYFNGVDVVSNDGICTLIFTDGSWKQTGGIWD